MPDTLGLVNVPAPPAASGVFPLTPDYPVGRAEHFETAVHTFSSGNRKVEQRFAIGSLRRFTVTAQSMTENERISLWDFFEQHKGSHVPFTYNAPNADGTTTAYTVRFEREPLSWDHLAGLLSSTGVTLVGEPSAAPTYTLNGTDARFPRAALQAALLSQVQELIPLVKIAPKTAGYPAVYVSDRRCTVGTQLYLPRLLSFDGISQTLGSESDDARFTFGNADRVMAALAADTNLDRARVEFSLFHVGTGIKLDLWAGEIRDWQGEASDEFTVTASDSFHDTNLLYPRLVERTCWKDFKDGANCPYAGAETACDKSWTACQARGMQRWFGGIYIDPSGVRIKDNSTGRWGIGRNTITATSIIEDSVYGKPLQDIYTDSDMPVACPVIAGRDESDFYIGLGIVGAGPLGAYSPSLTAHMLDDSAAHQSSALRLVSGTDPAGAADSECFNLHPTKDDKRAAGVAFAEIRRSDAKGIQPSRTADHKMTVTVRQGRRGWVWTGSGSRSEQLLTNPVWIAVNTMLRAKGLYAASAAVQEAEFDVAAAIAAANVCNTSVTKLIGTGTETQFKFRGLLAEQKTLDDWLSEILTNCLGYHTVAFGRLKIGVRVNSSAVEAFTEGNIIADSLELQPLAPSYNHLTAVFADADLDYATGTLPLYDIGHAKLRGSATAPLYLKAQRNLAGTTTKSQAARIITTELREELGGITAQEWAKARRGSFRTTVLALNTEVGQVCSLTHPDMPGGAGEFRVTRWALNPDYSITIEWRTTTDSMYDYAIGPKPADVEASPVPVEPVSLVPSEVVPIGGEPFLVTVVEDGANARVQIAYEPASPLGVFTGVSAHSIDSDGEYTHHGDADYNGDGNAAAGSAARQGTLQVLIPQPADADHDWTVYLTPRSRAYRKPLITLPATNASPHKTVTIHRATAAGQPDQPDASGWSATVGPYSRDEVTGQQIARIRITITERPTGADYFSFFVYRGASAPADMSLWGDGIGSVAMAASGDTIIDHWVKVEAAGAYTLQLAVTASSYTYFSFPTASTPVKAVTIAQATMAPQVTGASVTVELGNAGGVPSGRFQYGFTAPVSTEWRDVRIERIRRANASFDALAGAEWGTVAWESKPQSETSWWPLPPAAEYWTFRFASQNFAQQINTTAMPTVNVTVPASDGVDASKLKNVGPGLAVTPDGLIATGRAGNAVENYEFEQGLVGWRTSDAAVVIDETAANVHSGTKACKLPPGKWIDQLINCKPGDRFVWEPYVKAPNGPVICAIEFYTKAGSPLGAGGSLTGSVTAASYTSITTRLATAPATAALMRVLVQNNGTADAWVDQCRLKVGADATELGSIDALPKDVNLTNAGFEAELFGWSYSPGVSVTTAPGTYYSGTKGAQVTGQYQHIAQEIPCKPGDAFILETYVRSATGTTGSVQSLLRFRDASGNDITPLPSPGTRNASTSWGVMRTPVAIAPAGTVKVVPHAIYTDNSTGTWYIDQVVLYRAPDAAALQNTNTAEFEVVNGKLQMKAVDLTKATNFNTDEFEKTPGTLIMRIKALFAEKLKGEYVQIGGTGTKVSRLKIFGVGSLASTLIGWIGDDTVTTENPTGSGYFGAWLERLLIGGGHPSTPKAGIDSNGNWFSKGSLTLDLNGIIASVTNGYQNPEGTTKPAGFCVDAKNDIGVGGIKWRAYMTSDGFYIDDFGSGDPRTLMALTVVYRAGVGRVAKLYLYPGIVVDGASGVGSA